jgi:hypothetical protein
MIRARTKFVLAACMDHKTTLNCVERKYIDLSGMYLQGMEVEDRNVRV